MKATLARIGQIRPWAVIATIAGLGAFALGQPLLDLLGRNPEFFIARRFPALDIAVLGVVLMAVPLVLALVVFLVRRVDPVAGGVTHLVVIGALVALAAAATLVTAGLATWPTVWFAAATIGVAVGVAFAYAAIPLVRTGLTYLGLAPVVFLAWFAFATPTSDVLFSSPAEVPEAVDVRRPFPVVMIVYDEFPVASMMAGDGSLDAEHFPNFSRLATDGVWYRNAIGVRQQTEEAVPSLLTGRAVPEGSIPVTSNHPFTIFSLLSGEYDVEAIENVTELCPTFICGNVSRPVDPVTERWSSVATDLAVVYGHLVTPDALADSLPPVDQGWGGFGQVLGEDFDIIERFIDEVSQDRRRDLERFLESVGRMGERAALRYAHFLYPHHPWDLTADGRVHLAPRPPGRDGVGWGDDEFLVAQGWQRHLIQTHWADTMLGRVLDRLDAIGKYDESLVVVVADHGITIQPGVHHQRVVAEETTGTIAFVPLFVKYPASFESAPEPGTVDDLRAETVDIVPTIGEVLDVTIPWRTDGVSLLDRDSRSGRSSSLMLGTEGEVEIPSETEAVSEVVAEQLSWFPDGDPYRLTPPGWEGLLGRSDVTSVEQADVEMTVDQSEALASHVDGGDPIPAYLSGEVTVASGVSGDEIVAITADGEVVAVTRTYQPNGTTARWEAMIDPGILDAGRRPVEAWLVTGSADNPRFAR